MANLMRWDPFQDFRDMSRSFDRLFDDFGLESGFGESCTPPAVEGYRHDGSYVIRVDLPGVNPKEVNLNFQGGVLTIEGERKKAHSVEGDQPLQEEVCYGPFRRSLYIPEGIKGDQIKARYHDGVLEVTAPLDEKFLPRKIEVEEIKG